MEASERTFHLFPRLPAELRLAIWRECLPRRVSELEAPLSDDVFDWIRRSPSTWNKPLPCDLTHTSFANQCRPMIALVCRESRAVVLENGFYMGEADDFPYPDEVDWIGWCELKQWIDPTRDLSHLNYCPGNEALWYIDGNPLVDLAWQATWVHRGGSLRLPLLGYCDTKDLKILQKQPSWIVVMRVFVVHASRRFGAVSGMFGLLGDAPVQVVDVADQARVTALFDLAEECERKGNAKVRQKFRRETPESLSQELQDVVKRRFRSQQAPKMHPALMFRLCTKMCNHLDPADDGCP
ncbi:uncharacterized protein N7482_009283 [Penicillium canariense]|uniref:2EXR domain-containing protein n=1 Tax=Penicillium canariense TaxID=189055 RepID=A0A9W9HQ34_9EURO|nr:uncharacterized protein N7482_009283 [Penicillium canariense]KAJ5152805.1 hypothetical protein N7482_009283 [Penicillium canariense]